MLSGLEQAAHDWDLIGACHNLMKLHSMQTKTLLAPQAALRSGRPEGANATPVLFSVGTRTTQTPKSFTTVPAPAGPLRQC